MPLSKIEIEKYLSEVLDAKRTLIICKRHMYTGGNIPPRASGCKDCWFAFYLHDLASTPPHMRAQRLEELETMIHHAVEAEEAGDFDFEVFDSAEITITKNAKPDRIN